MFHLPDEIWFLIFKFLNFEDIFKFKFLSKRGNEIYFLLGEKRLFFLIQKSKKIFNVEIFYDKVQQFFNKELFTEIKEEFSFIKYLLLIFLFEEIYNDLSLSNFFSHLFYCPRSIFAKNNCLKCSRVFLRKELEIRVDFIEEFNIFRYIESDEKLNDFEFNVFWSNKQQKEIIESDISRCLNSFVIQYYKEFLFLFLEINFRILSTFFFRIGKLIFNDISERKTFLNISFKFVKKIIIYFLYSVNLIELNNLFEEIDFDEFSHLKVINRKYKEDLKKKYED